MTIAEHDIVWSNPEVRASRLGTVLDHGSEADITRLVELAEPTERDEALDMIAGLGHVARALAPHAKKVDALDPDEEMLKEAEALTREPERGKIRFMEGDPLNVPCKAGTYRIVTARMALRHLGDGVQFVREVHRVLKPSGRFLLVDSLSPPQPDLEGFLKDLLCHNDRSHVKSYTLAELESLLERENFDIDLIEIYPKEHDFDTWAGKLGESGDSARMIEKMLRSASTRARRHFRVVVKGRKLVSFVTWMILIRARPALI